MIRTGASSDVAAVLRLWETAAAAPSITDDADGIGMLLARDPEALLVAERDGELVGTLVAAWDGWRCYLYRLAVHPAYRGQGIGRALVEAGEARLVALGGRRTDALVLDDDERAQGFWRELGYVSDPGLTRWTRSVRLR